MNNQLDRLEAKLDQIADAIVDMKVTQAKQAKDLAHHIYRTDLLEEQVKPVVKHVSRVEGAVKLLGLISLVLGIIYTAMRLK